MPYHAKTHGRLHIIGGAIYFQHNFTCIRLIDIRHCAHNDNLFANQQQNALAEELLVDQ